MIRELKSSEAAAEENDIICHLLLTMPVEYDMVVTETMAGKTDLSLSIVKNKLFNEESKLAKRRNKTKGEQPNSPTAFALHASRSGRGRNGSQNTNYRNSGTEQANKKGFQFACHNCGGIGHKRTDCKKPNQIICRYK